MTEMICPKCQGAMRTYERNGVHIEQCGDCRGIFLDKGELEHLASAEARWQAAPPAPASPPPAYNAPAPSYGSPQPVYYKRKKSFLHELFD
jgi:Zn-finger nucleic acid-binding protein